MDSANSIYFLTAVKKWYIGPSIGSSSRGIERISNRTGNDYWYEWDGSKWIAANQVQLKCIDQIECSCKNLDISGFDFHGLRHGLYVAQNTVLHGRKCFSVKHKLV